MFKFGKPSISIRAIENHGGTVSHNPRSEGIWDYHHHYPKIILRFIWDLYGISWDVLSLPATSPHPHDIPMISIAAAAGDPFHSLGRSDERLAAGDAAPHDPARRGGVE